MSMGSVRCPQICRGLSQMLVTKSKQPHAPMPITGPSLLSAVDCFCALAGTTTGQRNMMARKANIMSGIEVATRWECLRVGRLGRRDIVRSL